MEENDVKSTRGETRLEIRIEKGWKNFELKIWQDN